MLLLSINLTFQQFHAGTTDQRRTRQPAHGASRVRTRTRPDPGGHQTGGPLNRHPKQTYKFLRTYPDGVLAPATGFYSRCTEPPVWNRERHPSGDDPACSSTGSNNFVAGRVPEGGRGADDPGGLRAEGRSVRTRRKIGSVTAIDPKTGAILAPRPVTQLRSQRPGTHDAAAAQDYYEQLDADPDKPLLNRPLVQTIPGFHVQTRDGRGSGRRLRAGFGAARPGVRPPAARLVEVTGELVGRPLRPRQPHDTGQRPCVSCNSAFAYLGNDLGADALRTQARKFGFESSFDVPMTAATSRYPEDPDDAQTAMSAIGQFDVAATSLQMAMVTAAIANQGVTMSPYLVNQILAPT